VLAYFLFVALTNLVLGAVLGYYYGPVFLAARQSEASAAEHSHAAHPAAESHGHAPAEASVAPAPLTAPEPTAVAAPAASAAPETAAEDLRPVKQTGSREVSAVDLADVMSELGVAPPEAAATAPAAAPPAAAPIPAPTAAAPELALASEAAPLAG
jgi:hypothetical protein